MSDDKKGELKLVFVYAADSGFFTSLLHYAQKMIAPATYNCQLCMLTTGALGTEKAWTQFLRELALPVSFLHRDELVALHPEENATPLPVVYAERDRALEVIVTAKEIDDCADLRSLIDIVRSRVDVARAPTVPPARKAS